jgi:predicted transcriptional regulator
MRRRRKLTIRLSRDERAAVDALAQAERLPTSTLARRLLLLAVDRRGLWPSAENEESGDEQRSVSATVTD